MTDRSMLSAAPMPWPMDLYQETLSFSMSMAAAVQSASSAMWVPLRSPREMNGAALALIAFSAATMSLLPLIAAGSLEGLRLG